MTSSTVPYGNSSEDCGLISNPNIISNNNIPFVVPCLGYLANIKSPFLKENGKRIISALLTERWWDWPEEKIARNLAAIQSGHVDQCSYAHGGLHPMQGCLTKLRILFHCLLDGGQFKVSQSSRPARTRSPPWVHCQYTCLPATYSGSSQPQPACHGTPGWCTGTPCHCGTGDERPGWPRGPDPASHRPARCHWRPGGQRRRSACRTSPIWR